MTDPHRLPALALLCEHRSAVLRGLTARLGAIDHDVSVFVKGGQHAPRTPWEFHSDAVERVIGARNDQRLQPPTRVDGHRSNVRTCDVPPLYPPTTKRLDCDPITVDRHRAEPPPHCMAPCPQTNAKDRHARFLLPDDPHRLPAGALLRAWNGSYAPAVLADDVAPRAAMGRSTPDRISVAVTTHTLVPSKP